MARYSLDSLTLTDTEPMEIIRAAAEAGYDIVSLWVQEPPLFPSPLVTAEKEADCARALADSDLEVVAIEAFDLHSRAAVESYRPALERGARLGGKVALTINFSNPDAGEVADILGAFAERAAECGLGTNLEPVGGGHTSTLEGAAKLIAASGADVGITFDPWHLVASGSSVDDIGAIDPALIRYVQLCDGPVPMPDDRITTGAVCERGYPGEGAFPLAEMLRRLPRDVPVGGECPSVRRAQAGMSPLDQARDVLAAMKRVMAEAGR